MPLEPLLKSNTRDRHAAPGARAAAALLLAALLVQPATAAESLPLWEAGAGVAAINFPDYRGSDERTTFVLPFPYLVYRGEFLKADRERVRGLFYKSERIELNVSINGSIPVDSSKNAARRGMPDLDPNVQIGPNLEIGLYRGAGDELRIELRLPVRAVIATDFSRFYDIGWVFEPTINTDLRNTFIGEDWKLGFAFGPLFGDRRFHNYYFGVAPQFATATRSAYEAPGGFAGVQAIGAISRRFPKYWIGAFVRWDTLDGAVFESSPLVRQQTSFSTGFAIAWLLGESSRRVVNDR